MSENYYYLPLTYEKFKQMTICMNQEERFLASCTATVILNRKKCYKHL